MLVVDADVLLPVDGLDFFQQVALQVFLAVDPQNVVGISGPR